MFFFFVFSLLFLLSSTVAPAVNTEHDAYHCEDSDGACAITGDRGALLPSELTAGAGLGRAQQAGKGDTLLARWRARSAKQIQEARAKIMGDGAEDALRVGESSLSRGRGEGEGREEKWASAESHNCRAGDGTAQEQANVSARMF